MYLGGDQLYVCTYILDLRTSTTHFPHVKPSQQHEGSAIADRYQGLQFLQSSHPGL